MKLTIILLLLLNLISGCTPPGGFYPTDSECRKIHHQLIFMEHNNYSYYQNDLKSLEKKAEKCKNIEFQSRKDYKKFESLDEQINALSNEADKLIEQSDKLLLED